MSERTRADLQEANARLHAENAQLRANGDALERMRTTLEEIRRAARYDQPTSDLLNEIEEKAEEALK